MNYYIPFALNCFCFVAYMLLFIIGKKENKAMYFACACAWFAATISAWTVIEKQEIIDQLHHRLNSEHVEHRLNTYYFYADDDAFPVVWTFKKTD